MKTQEVTREKFISQIESLKEQIKKLKANEEGHEKLEEALRASNERFRFLFNTAPIGLSISNVQGNIFDANKAIQGLLGYTLEELKTMNYIDFYSVREDRQRFLDILLKENRVHDFETVFKHKDGSLWNVLINSEYIQMDNNKSILTSINDITQFNQMHECLRESETELQKANQKLAGWVRELEARSTEMDLVSEMGEQLQNCLNIEEASNISAQYIQKIFPESHGALYLINPSKDLVEAVAMWGEPALTKKIFSPVNCWAIRRSHPHLADKDHPGLLCGHITGPAQGQYLCVPMMAQGEIMGVLHLNYNISDMDQSKSSDMQYSERKTQLVMDVAEHIALALSSLKLRDTLRQQSIRDILTGLFNRRYMEETLPREIHRAEREKKPIGVIMFDIDHFKEYNDLAGHDGGDALLRELGVFLKKSVRGGDIVCRYGGEEFFAVLPGASLENTKMRAEEIRQGVKDLLVYYLGKPLGKCTISLGVAAYPGHGVTCDELLKCADGALYRAKNEGRDRVVVASAVG